MILNTAAISFCFSLAALTLLQGSSCKGSGTPNSNAVRTNSSSPATELPSGTWGGLHVGMEISNKGAELNFDCAHGSITQKLVPDNVGRFVAKGIYVREHPGAMRQDESPAGTTASYQGTIKGETMKLTVILPDTNETVGSFTLTRGNAGKVRKCM